jgi:hypothetical protein
MIIAMIAVRVVQVTTDQVVHVVAVRHSLVPTAWTMHMLLVVTVAGVLRGTAGRVLGRHLENVFVDMVSVNVVQVSIVEKIGVPVMVDGGVATATAVRVVVARMLRAVLHGTLLFGKKGSLNLPF